MGIMGAHEKRLCEACIMGKCKSLAVRYVAKGEERHRDDSSGSSDSD